MLPLALAAVAAWVLSRRRHPRVSRRRSTLALFALGFVLTLALARCGGGGGSPVGPPSNPGTPAGTYTLTVTGTTGSGSSTVSHSMTLTLTVS